MRRPSGQRFSVNKAHKDLKSRGFQVSRDTLHALLSHFEDAYLVHTVPIFSQSERVIASNPRKAYAVDPGLASALSHVTATNLGTRLETAVFLELRRRAGRMLTGQISFYVTGQGHEIDFVVGDPFSRHAADLIQVSASLADASTREREVRALTAGMHELGIRESMIVTMNETGTLEVESGTIFIVPAWQWLSRPSDDPTSSGADGTTEGEDA